MGSQPMSGPTQPVASSACRKACCRKGESPASAFQVSAGSSAMRGMTRMTASASEGFASKCTFWRLSEKTMNLHDFQAKQILRSGNINTPRGMAATSADAAVNAASELGGDAWVVKAQIHAGGRGKAGGVKVVKSLDAVRSLAGSLLGRSLVTKQNAPDRKSTRLNS